MYYRKIKQKIVFLIIACLCISKGIYAQTDEDAKPVIIDKTDIIAFHRQILSLKEYIEERSKIPSLQKINKVTVRVKAIVDTNNSNSDGEDEVKTNKLIGYIRQEVGDNAANIYEVTYDRTKKKITAVVPTGDSLENIKTKKPAIEKKQGTNKAAAKKVKDEDDEDMDDKAPQKKEKDTDEDN